MKNTLQSRVIVSIDAKPAQENGIEIPVVVLPSVGHQLMLSAEEIRQLKLASASANDVAVYTYVTSVRHHRGHLKGEDYIHLILSRYQPK